MPRINLLPVRAARQADLARRELGAVAGLLLAVVAGLYAWYLAGEGQIAARQANLDGLHADIARVEKVVAKVEEFKKRAATLERKLEVIEQLKRQKVGPAKMLADLATILTKQHKVWLTRIEEKDGAMTLRGGAMEQENISEFQLALESQSKFFSGITLTLVSSAKQGDATFFEWAISCQTHYAAG